MDITRTSQEWYDLIPKEYQLVIYDPDGWDRSNFDYSFNEELITKEEFQMRLSSSTTVCDTSFFDFDWNKI